MTSEPRTQATVDELADLLRTRPCVVLSGAGCSTESGIPDYRGPDGSLKGRQPIRFQEFMNAPEKRTRYWARSMIGWPRFSSSRPNAAHRALAALERKGFVRGVITQNVDGLHQAAGSRAVVDLHGRLDEVVCMGCGDVTSRTDVQRQLKLLNPRFEASASRYVADGDAELAAGSEQGFSVPDCARCGGILKPNVVFFGENVPKDRLARTWDLFARGELLLVVGSSLTVFSGRRFVLRAVKEHKPVAIANQGPTRGDDVAACRLDARLGAVLPALAERLEARGAAT
ncbi:MAG: NAD-dependent protein deacetylase [Gemmatimonadota bacterium]|nr:NAD-dependent protein deacetylase [Gemmatimonadota bacterium]